MRSCEGSAVSDRMIVFPAAAMRANRLLECRRSPSSASQAAMCVHGSLGTPCRWLQHGEMRDTLYSDSLGK